jgi:phage tail-like protein
MDVNGTRFQLLLGMGDWGNCVTDDERQLAGLWAAREPADVSYDGERDELTLAPLPFLFPEGTGPGLDPAIRRGAARDRYGSWYWIDALSATLLVQSAGTGQTTPFWRVNDPVGTPSATGDSPFAPTVSAPPPAPLNLGGAAVTADDYLVAGTTLPAGLLVFDLRAGGSPQPMTWPSGVPFVPFDMVARPQGGLYILDRVNRTYWELDRHFLAVSHQPTTPPGGPAPAFGPVDGQPPQPSAPCAPPEPLSLAVATSLTDGSATPDPIAVEAAADGTVLVLFRGPPGGPSLLRAYRDGMPLGPAVPLADPVLGLAVTAHDIALVPAAAGAAPELAGQLFAADFHGDQAFEFTLSLSDNNIVLAAAPRYYPMRLFGGKALVSAAGQVWYDFTDRFLALAEQPRRRYETTAVIRTPALDGGEPGCVWHRLMFDAILPSQCQIQVWSATADDPAFLAQDPVWQREPTPYTRGDGPEIPYLPPGPYRTLELCLQQARGRYLRLRLELSGNARATPRIRALRAYYPRFSYLERYLPAVYQGDDGSAAFLDRFLANVEGTDTAVEDRIAAVQVLFDPRTTPSSALEWLGNWFDLAMDPAWNDATRRLLLGHAMDFFAWRGTVRGLRAALALVIEPVPDASVFSDAPGLCALRTRIVELYQTKVTPGVALGDPTAAVPPAPGPRWRPADGAEALNEQYRAALTAAGVAADATTRFPIAPPDEAGPGDPNASTLAAVWTAVARTALGFLPATLDADLPAWRTFLAGRYPRIADLVAAYQLPAQTTTFDQVGWPNGLPDREPELTDWYQFQAAVLPGRAAAHRFRVLLPVSAQTRAGAGPSGLADRNTLSALAGRVVDLAKPAHTVFDVKFYWDAFRVGEARLGLDTLVDLGARSPDLTAPAVLGGAYLGQSVLTDPAQAACSPLPCPPTANRRW